MKKLHYLIIAMLLGFYLNAQVFVTGGGVGGWDPNGRVFLTSTDGINYSSTADFEITGSVKIGEAPGWQTIWGYDSALGSGWPGGTLPSTCGDCGTDISPTANGWYSVTYNINTNEYLFSPGINPFGPYPSFAPATPLTFEEPQTSIYYKFEDFGNETNQGDPKGGLTKIANPHKEGINTSNTVFQMIKRGWASWSGSKFFTAPAIDFSASSKIIKIKIWSPRVGAKLKLKFEGDGDDQLEVASTVANAWEELIFDFSSKTMGTTRNQIAFQFEDGLNNGFDPNTPDQSNVADYTWLIDDISIVIAPPTAASQTFCSSASATVNDLVATGIALKWYAAASGGSALASNEALVEGTYYVSQTVGGNESARTPVAVTIISNTGVNISACGTSYTWPLSGLTYTESGNYEYTFGSCVTMLNLTLTPITYNTTVVSAENPYTWSNNGQVYATNGIKTGTTTNCVTELLDLTITNPVVFVTGGGVGGWDPNGKVFLTSTDGINYSSTSDFEVTGDLKIGEATGWQNIWGYDETLGSGWPGGTLPNNCRDCGKNISPAANGWYNVTYNRNTKVYLFTEGINPYGSYPTFAPSSPLTFEEPQTSIYYKFENFGNHTSSDPKGGLTKIDNPHKEGINTSNTVFQMIKRGASWSGSKLFTASPIDFSASTKIVKVKIWSPKVGAKLKLKFEGGAGDDQVEVASTLANAWEELIFDFSNKTMGTSRKEIVFQFDDGLNDGASGLSDVTDFTWLIDDISLTQIPTTFPAFCKGATVANAAGATTMKFYTALTGGLPLAGTTALATKTLFVSEMVGLSESSPRVARLITVNPLPTEVLGAMTSNTVSATTTTGFVATTLVVGQYVGTTTPISYRIPPFTGTGLTYYWAVPTGVNIVSQTDNVLTVNFLNVTSGIGAVGSITVQAQNASGCRTAAKSIAVSKVLPAAPGSIKMTNASIPVAEGKTAAAITTFAPYMGTDTILTLTATPSLTATSYSWELPTGVTQVSGGNTNVITVKFAGVTSSNTFNYLSTANVPVSTNVLRIGVKSVNGVGNSSTSNTLLANSSADFYPNSTSTAKLLTLTAIKPASPASLKMTEGVSTTAVTSISKYIGKTTEFTLTAAVSPLASSYEWELPSSVTLISGGSSNVITVNFANVPAGTTSLYLGVKAVNGIGSSLKVNAATLVPSTSSKATLLKVTAAAPAAAGITTGSLAICSTAASSVTYTITTAAKDANTYNITAPAGCTITNGIDNTATIAATAGATFTVNYPSGFIANTTTAIKTISIQSENGFGVNTLATNKVLKLTNTGAVCIPVSGNGRFAPKVITEEFNVIAYPNPSLDVFTLEVQSSGKGKATTEVQVYDMTGRLIEQRQVESNSVEVGNNYPTGVYNVIVSQGENTKSLRVIKK